MKKLLKNKKGFTLIELIVVIAILAILAAILIPSVSSYISSATVAKNTENARSHYTEYQLTVTTTNVADGTYTPFTDCSATVASKQVTAFSCTYDTKTYSLVNNFSPS